MKFNSDTGLNMADDKIFEQYFTTAEIAKVLDVSTSYIRQQIARGKLKARKRSKTWYIHHTEAERYIKLKQSQKS